jgi:hypothetical protein
MTDINDAVEKSNLDNLKYLHKNGYKYVNINGYRWDKSTCSIAAWNGDIKCLKYAHENGCPWMN